MTATAAARARQRGHGEARVRAPVLGMALFVASEVMFFGGLFGAYFTLRAGAAEWPPPGTPQMELGLPLALTAVLLSSSLTQHLAAGALRRDDRRSATRWLLATVALGAGFLVGEGWEWRELIGDGFSVRTNVFGTLFYALTGFHGLHLGAGLLMLLFALARIHRSRLHPVGTGAFEAATLYWHFVDGVWLFLLTSLYLLDAFA